MSPEIVRYEVRIEHVDSLSENDIPAPTQTPIYLTEAQYETYKLLWEHWTTKGSLPTVREICTSLGISSTNTVTERLARLEKHQCLYDTGKGNIKNYALRAKPEDVLLKE